MTDALTSLFILGGMIFAGFFAMQLFERTKIPDLLILMFLGVLIGPVLGVIDPEPLFALVPFFAALALIILLFDGGINVVFAKLLNELSRAATFTFTCFILTMALVTLATTFLFNWNPLFGLLLGAVLGGTGSAVVIPLISQISGSEKDKDVLKIESALTDALSVVVAITLVKIIVSGNASVSGALNSLLASFSIAIVLGAIAGGLWIRMLTDFHKKSYGYLLTLATSFLLYSVVEAVQANGAIAVLSFGIVLGNAFEVSKLLKMKQELKLGESIKNFQKEVSFFVKTFFFFYLGLLFKFSFEILFLALVASVIAMLVIARYATTKLFNWNNKNRNTRRMWFAIQGRGMAAAVLATLPFSEGLTIAKYPLELAFFQDLVLLAIFITNLITAILIFWYEKTRSVASEEKQGPKIVEVKKGKK